MTIDEAIKVLENEIKCVDRDCDIERSCGKCPYAMPTKEPILEAYNMAIVALEQQPILDKIRAEIAEYGSIWVEYKILDEEGFLEEPCLSCDKAYIENLWSEWCCDEKECPHKEERGEAK